MPPIRAKTIRRPREDPTIEDPTLALDIYTRCVLPEEGEDLMEQIKCAGRAGIISYILWVWQLVQIKPPPPHPTPPHTHVGPRVPTLYSPAHTHPPLRPSRPLSEVCATFHLQEWAFWIGAGGVACFAYFQASGGWPDLSNAEDQAKVAHHMHIHSADAVHMVGHLAGGSVKEKGVHTVFAYALRTLTPDCTYTDCVHPASVKVGASAFAFVNVARLAVPLRIGLASRSRMTPAPSTHVITAATLGPTGFPEGSGRALVLTPASNLARRPPKSRRSRPAARLRLSAPRWGAPLPAKCLTLTLSGLALGTTPWVDENIVQPFLGGDDKDGDQAGDSDGDGDP
jgi:hypothetical protein